MDEAGRITERHREIRQFLDWRDEVDGPRLETLLPVLEPYLPALVDDFYEEIVRHPRAAAVFTGGAEQVGRLKGSLHRWVIELLRTLPDDAYAARCWRVGRRHAELRLDPLYVIAAMGRLRLGLRHATHASWTGPPWELPDAPALARPPARPRPGADPGRLPGRERRPAPAGRAVRHARPGRRRARARAAEPPERRQDLGLLPARTRGPPRPRSRPSTSGGSAGASTGPTR